MSRPRPAPSRPLQREERTHASMWRVLLVGSVLVGLLALYLGPQTKAGRDWLLGFAQRAVEEAGYTLSYRESRGNLWSGVSLQGVTVKGPGAEVELAGVQLGYSLPVLLTRKLPLSVALEGVRGEVALDKLELSEGDGEAPIELVLRKLSVDDVALDVDGAPYTLPDLSVSEVRVENAGEGVRVAGSLASPEGRADVSAWVRLEPSGLEAEILHADASLARHWWEGAEGGAVTGTVTVHGGEVRAELNLENGVVSVAGWNASEVSGPVRFEDARVVADLRGRTLGGPIRAKGYVDVGARHWEAELRAQPTLEGIATSLLGENAPPATGEATVSAELSGWREVSLSARVTGEGSVAGRELEGLQGTFELRGDEASADVAVHYGGAPVKVAVQPSDGGGLTLNVQATGLPLTERLSGNLQANLTGRPDSLGSLQGEANLTLSGELRGEPLSLALNGAVEGGTLELTLPEGEALGGTLSGTLTLTEETGRGGLTAQGLQVPGLSAPVGLRLSADGALEALPLTLEVSADAPLGFSFDNTTLAADLRGEVSGRLEGTRLEGLEGRLGPLAFGGTFGVAEQNGELTYTLAETPLQGEIRGTIALGEGRLAFSEGELSTQAALLTSPLQINAVELPALRAVLAGGVSDGLRVSLTDEGNGLRVMLAEGELNASFAGTELELFDTPVTLEGDTALSIAAPLDTLSGTLNARTPQGEGLVTGAGDAVTVDFSSEAGASFGPVTLGETAELSGRFAPEGRALTLSGTLGEVGGALEAQLGETLSGEAALTTDGETLTLSVTSAASGTLATPLWTSAGTLDLTTLGRTLGLELLGRLETDLSHTEAGYAGEARLEGALSGVPFDATLQGREAIVATVATQLGGVLLRLDGPLFPEAAAMVSLAEVGTGRLSGPLNALTLLGEGETPAFARGGFVVPPRPWRVSANMAEGAARLDLGESVITATWRGDAWSLEGDITQSARFRALDATVVAEIHANSDAPQGVAFGRLELHTPEGTAALPLSGSLLELTVGGSLPAALLGAGVGAGVPFRGEVALDGTVSPLAGSYALSAVWEADTPLLALEVAGEGDAVAASARGEGLEAGFGPDGLRVTADGFDLGTLFDSVFDSARLAGDATSATLSGELRGLSENGWAGGLTVRTEGVVDSTLTLSGAGERLGFEAVAEDDAYEATVTGTLLPTLDLGVTAGVADGALTLSGGLEASGFQGTLALAETTQPAAGFTLPARLFSVVADTAGVRVSGEETDLSLVEGAWSGGVTLPFVLQGESHRVNVRAAGSAATPVLRGEVRGSLLAGSLETTGEDLSSTLTLDASSWLPLGSPRVGVTLKVSRDLTWEAVLNGEGRYSALPLGLEATVRGEGLRYRATGAARFAEQMLPITVQGERTTLTADFSASNVALAPLSAALPVALDGTLNGGGRITLGEGSEYGLKYEITLEATGTAQERPFDLALTARDDALLLQGNAAGVALSVQETPSGTLTFEASEPEVDLALSGSLSLGETFLLEGTGRYGSESVTLQASYTPTEARARWSAGIVGAEFLGRLEDGVFMSSLDVPRGRLPGLPAQALTAEARGELSPDGVSLSSLLVETTDETTGERSAELQLAGSLRPTPHLTGNLAVAGVAEPTRVTVLSGEAGYKLFARQGELLALAYLTPAGPLALGLTGEMRLDEVEVTSDLHWRPAEGFSGSAEARVLDEETGAALTLAGEGTLSVTGEFEYQAQTLARLTATLSPAPWENRALDGMLDVSLPLSHFSPVPLGEEATLSGTLLLSGSLDAPQLAGPLALSGALTAAGSVEATLGGVGLALQGPGLRLKGAYGDSGLVLEGTAETLDLAHLFPDLRAPRVSATFRAVRAPGEPWTASVQGLELATARSTVFGEVTRDGTYEGTLDLNLNLADYSPEGEAQQLRGTLRGPLTFSSETLTGRLTAENLGLLGSPWGLAGAAMLGGSVNNPALELRLQGQGTASGGLQARLEPRAAHYTLESNLTVAELSSAASLELSPDGVAAAGELGWGDYLVSLEGSGDILRLTGNGTLRGWRGAVYPEEAQATLSGELSSLSSQVSGEIALKGGWQGGPQLSGVLSGLEVAGTPLGRLDVVAGAEGATLEGDALSATLAFTDGVAWDVQRLHIPLEVPLGEAFGVAATGAGTLEEGVLDVTLEGNLPDESVVLPLRASYGESGWALDADTTLLSGPFTLAARFERETGWAGGLEWTGARVQGTDLSLHGEVDGPLAAPELSGSVHASLGESVLESEVVASPAVLELTSFLTSPLLDTPLEVVGSLRPKLELSLVSGEEQLELFQNSDGTLTSRGALGLEVGGAALGLEGSAEGDPLTATLRPGPPGLAFVTTLGNLSVIELSKGVSLQGIEATEGMVTLRNDEGFVLEVDGVRYAGPAGTLALSGAVGRQGALTGTLQGSWQGEPDNAAFPWLATEPLPFTLEFGDDLVTFRSESALGLVDGSLGLPARDLKLNVALREDGGSLTGLLGWNPEGGLQGRATLTEVPLATLGGTGEPLTLSGDITFDEGGARGSGSLGAGTGTARVEGAVGWAQVLPETLLIRYLPEAENTLEGEFRVDAFDLATLPGLSGFPYLSAPVSGIAQLRGESVVGSLLLPELSVAGERLPSNFEFNGTLASLEVRGELGRSRVNATLADGRLTGTATFEGFPLQTLAEAAVGDTGVEASLTGVARLELPLDQPAEGAFGLASERIILERGGVVSRGNVAVRFEEGVLTIDEVDFNGAGHWQASGRVSRETLDLDIEAQDADFRPLLGLVPRFAAFGVGAQGSLLLRADGSLENPDISLTSPGLEFFVGTQAYQLEEVELSLQGDRLNTQARLVGLEPVTGTLTLHGGGGMSLLPLRSDNLNFALAGALTVPVVGEVADIEGFVTATAEGGWRLWSQGMLGNPLTVEGSLVPLDLAFGGQGLQVGAPRFFLTESLLDVQGRLRLEEAFILSGEVLVREAQLSGAEREADAASLRGDIEAAETDRNPLLERILFDDITVRAPQEVRFEAGFGNAELGFDVTLSGSAAEPEVNGAARGLRGGFAFAGRDFALDRAVADFDATSGAFPLLEAYASTTFEKAAVLPANGNVDFVEPRNSSSFTVSLELDGQLGTSEGPLPTLQLTPVLSSDARVADALGGPRSLTQEELLALLAVGKLELGPGIVGGGSLGGSVAQSALDTALDVFVAEFQSALGEALGVDQLEIRTSPLSSLLTGGDGSDDFGISLQVGGYVAQDLFASYRIGRYSDPDQAYALSNEFNLRYDLSPLEVNLTGGLNFLDTNPDPLPQFGLSLGYGVTSLINLEAGIDVSSARQSFGLGVNIRW